MDSEIEQVSGSRPGIDTARNPTEASHSSLDSSEPSSGVRGSKRRGETAATPRDSDKSVRVLRARRAAAHRGSDARNVRCDEKPARLRRVRGTPVGSRSGNTPAMQ